MGDDRADQAWDQNNQFSSKSLPSKEAQTREFVNSLALNCRLVETPRSGRGSNPGQLGRDLPGRDLELYESWLDEAHRHFRQASHQDVTLTYASEWVLDNYYIIRQAIQQIDEDLPYGFFKQLPRLSDGPRVGLPRIYGIAQEVLSYQRLLLDPIDLQTILILYQDSVPLTMGELWALPIFLRYSLIESLAYALVAAIHPPHTPKLPTVIPSLTNITEENIRVEKSPGETIQNDAVANIILSLRSISEQNWSDFFESVSCLERTLREDPAGIYPQMDFPTRDLYRKEIETLAMATGLEETKIAAIVLEMVPQPPIPPADTAIRVEESANTTDLDLLPAQVESTKANSHIGWYLLGNGKAELEKKIGYRPDLGTALKRSLFKHSTAFYLSSILVLTFLGLLTVALTINLPGSFHNSSLSFEVLPGIAAQFLGSIPFQWITLILLAITLMIPALTVATSLINWLITLTLRPHHLPKMDFKEEIPDAYQTLVVIPAMFGSHKEIDSLAHQLEMHYLRNPEPGLLYALLSDFPDADSEVLPEDEELIQYARLKIDFLNAKYGTTEPMIVNSETIDTGDEADASMYESCLFFLLHRKRLWNPSEGRWMGWERKRGKLQELNQLLRGASNLSFVDSDADAELRLQTKAANILQRTRFVITLDSDTILPRGAACRLAGTLAHPLNQAVFDEKTGRIISGYSILQPRMEIHPKGVNFSWFTRFFAGDAGLDLYTLAVSDAYQDLFGEGIYVGKGIYDVDAFERSTKDKFPENTVLSHDLLEGLMGRAGLVSDITMIEDYPQNYFIQAIRQRRWIRGDWQLLAWLLRPGVSPQIFSLIDRWKIFDNLRRSLLSPSLLLIFLLGLIFLPGSALLWIMVMLITLAIPLTTGLARSAIQILGGEYPVVALRPVGWNIVRWLLGIAFLPYEAYFSLDATLTTLYRMLISRRNLLQWTTAAQTAHVFGLQGRRNVAWQKLFASTILAMIMIVVIQLLSDQPAMAIAPALIVVSPVLVLWIISPFIV